MNNKFFVKVAVSVGLLIYLLLHLDFNELQAAFDQANLLLAACIYLTFIFGTALSSFKWKILMRAQGMRKPSFSSLWKLYFIGIFFSNFLPTEVGGDVYRAYAVGKANKNLSKSFVAVFMERITGVLALVIYAVLGLLINWALAKKINLIYFIFSGSLMIFISMWLIFNRDLIKKIRYKIGFKSINNALDKFKEFYDAIYLYRDKKTALILSMFISLVFQFYAILYSYCIFKALYIDIPFFNFILFIPVITIISLIPISINSIGLREGAFVYFFTYLGVTVSQSFTVAVFYRIGMVFPSVVGWIFYILGSNKYYKEEFSKDCL